MAPHLNPHSVYFRAVQAISALRAALSGAPDDQGILLNGEANLVPADANAITFPRTVSQVRRIASVYALRGQMNPCNCTVASAIPPALMQFT